MKGFWFYCAVVFFVIYGGWVLSDSQRDERIVQAGSALTSLEGMHLAKVSTFVDSWRATHKAPSPSDLTALQVDAERIKSNPSLVDTYLAQLRVLQKKQQQPSGVDNLVAQWPAVALIVLLVVGMAAFGFSRPGRD